MSIDPKTLPDGTVALISDGDGVVDISLVSLWHRGTRYSYRAEGRGGWSVQGHTITRVFVPVPEGMTYADAEAALADAPTSNRTCAACCNELVAAAERDAEARTVMTSLRGMFDPMTGRPAGGGW